MNRLQEGATFDADALRQCVEFFRFFADACHHAKEEDLLFPVLEERGIPREGGPIGVMLMEHKMARQFTADMAEALDRYGSGDAEGVERFRTAARAYVELLTHHIFKEDNVLFSMGDRVMSEADQASLGSRFCEVGCRAFGGKKKAELEAMAERLEGLCPPS